MTEAKDRIRQDQAALLDALKAAGADVSRPSAMRCPFHEDRHPSAGVYRDEEGVWRFKCQAASCGLLLDVFDVRQRTTGETVESQLSAIRKAETPEPQAKVFDTLERWRQSIPNPTTPYLYTDPDIGKVDLIKLRIELSNGEKTFKQAHYLPDGRLIVKAPATPHPIYNRTRVRGADQVVFVEGEKCVHAVTEAGYTATCCPGGGRKGSALTAGLSPLAGKTIILWPDHDPIGEDGDRGGHRHMREVAEQLKLLSPACSIWWLNPDDLKLGDKEDVADYLAKFEGTAKADAMSDALDLARPMGGSSELRDRLNDIISGKRSTIDFPYTGLSNLARPLMPGNVMVIVGAPGAAKSLFVCDCMIAWTRAEIPVAAYMLEDDRPFHMMRILAQLDGNEKLTDEKWVKEYPAEALAAEQRHRQTIDRISRHMSDAPEEVLTYDQILAWMKRVCECGARIVIVDPVTAVDAGKMPWESDRDFMVKAKAILRRHSASMVLVTHPRNDNVKAGHDGAAGSRAFGRFSQTMVWLTRPDGGEEKCVVTDSRTRMPTHCTADRYLLLSKVRNGRGQGLKLAFRFNTDSLTFHELGVFVKSIKQKDGSNEEC